MKHLRILRTKGASLDERREARTAIYSNLKIVFEKLLKELQEIAYYEGVGF